jgi:hypothetical protein
MTPKRPKSLKWIGEMYPDGRPARFLDFVPARDLDEAETDALDQDQLAVIRQSGLYREVAQPEAKKSAPKKSAPKAAVAQPEAPQPTESTDTGDEPIPAAEPATESEGQ